MGELGPVWRQRRDGELEDAYPTATDGVSVKAAGPRPAKPPLPYPFMISKAGPSDTCAVVTNPLLPQLPPPLFMTTGHGSNAVMEQPRGEWAVKLELLAGPSHCEPDVAAWAGRADAGMLVARPPLPLLSRGYDPSLSEHIKAAADDTGTAMAAVVVMAAVPGSGLREAVLPCSTVC